MSIRVAAAVSRKRVEPEKVSAADARGPRLAVSWERRGNRFSESLRALLSGPAAPREFAGDGFFRDCQVKGRVPRRSVGASVVWHLVTVVLLIQFGSILWTTQHVAAMRNFELTWSSPAADLPLISPAGHKKLPSPRGDPAKPLPQRGADAFHPRQTIISAPKTPNHPRQTLIRPDAPKEPPKFLPDMPNIVAWTAEPVRPNRQIASDKMVRQPKRDAKNPASANVAVPDVPNEEKNLAALNIVPASAPALSRPALTLTSGSSTTVAAPNQSHATPASTDPPPDIPVTTSGDQRIIAISATPGPAAPTAPVPAGNLSANVSISPEGKQPGVPGGAEKAAPGNGGSGGGPGSPGGNAGGRGRGTSAPGISITGGNPNNSPGISGLGNGNPSRNTPRNLRVMPGTLAAGDSARQPGASATKPSDVPVSERVNPGSPPEHIFGTRIIYTLNVNMPNLSSASGSWILKFAELDDDSGSVSAPRVRPGQLSGPVPLRKVDPRYPPEQIKAHIEGEVVLYAIIREDGSVDSIQVFRPLDPVLDKNAMDALAEWKFQPAQRNGAPVALEAVIHIPFHSAPRN